MNFTFFIPTRILFGTDSLMQFRHQQLPGSKAMIVMTTGSVATQSGCLEKVESELEQAGIPTEVFRCSLKDPLRSNVLAGARQVREKQCDFIVGLGDEACHDLAKGVAAVAGNVDVYWNFVTGRTEKPDVFQNPPLPVVTITAVPEKGSAPDTWSPETREETIRELGFDHGQIHPVISVFDPELLLRLPPFLAARHGFDVLLHCVEGYLSKASSPISDVIALKAIELVSRNLPLAIKDPASINAKENLVFAKTMSSVVDSLSSRLSEHALALSLVHGFPELSHGAALIMVSQAYYTHLAQIHACDGKLVELAKALGKTDAVHPMDFVVSLLRFQVSCGVDNLKMSHYGIKRQDLGQVAANARKMSGSLFRMDPADLSDEEAATILEQSFR